MLVLRKTKIPGCHPAISLGTNTNQLRRHQKRLAEFVPNLLGLVQQFKLSLSKAVFSALMLAASPLIAQPTNTCMKGVSRSFIPCT